MRYDVEFEIQSDLDAATSETVYKALVSALGRIDKFRLEQNRTYIGYVPENGPIFWNEVRPERPSDE